MIKNIDLASVERLRALKNPHVTQIVEKYAELCEPSKVTIFDDSEEGKEYIKNLALERGEEIKLEMEGHTAHFDGYYDQARDKKNTKILVDDEKMGKEIITGDRNTCLEEIFEIMKGIMKGKEMFVKFYCLGPKNSEFSLLALQITDSAYVIHSENILYRGGYDEFKKLNGSDNFFHFIHSTGEMENGKSKNIDKRRMYIDLKENRVFSTNTQYAGNTVGLKKLSLRLSIKKADEEGWLSEHMFIMGVKNEDGTINYFTGAFPSACGKTSTAMITGQTIVGDDLAYIREINGQMRAVNPEQGIFGIIENVNPVDDPLIYKTLTTPREIIFSNILVNNKKPYWIGMGIDIPDEGINPIGNWKKGMLDKGGNKIPPANSNSRYTIHLEDLDNIDSNLNNPEGVEVAGIIYGGRDSDTSPPVLESFDWEHGVFIGASIESETTTATIGKAGVRKHDPMANLDFLVIPLGRYINNYLKFGEKLDKKPKIFATNYFLKENGKYLNHKLDKKVWLLWMNGRVNGKYDAIKTPIGYIPRYEDLSKMFKDVFERDYSIEEYNQQFSIRINHLLDRLERIELIYRDEHEVPNEMWKQIEEQRKRLNTLKEKTDKTIVKPSEI